MMLGVGSKSEFLAKVFGIFSCFELGLILL
jgi:hypothetical protein